MTPLTVNTQNDKVTSLTPSEQRRKEAALAQIAKREAKIQKMFQKLGIPYVPAQNGGR
jgi:hypothetical protein